jgi:hypothetical protein
MTEALLTWVLVAGLAAPAQAPSSKADAFLPAGTQAVVTVNVKQMLGSPLVKNQLPKLEEQIKSNPEAQVALNALGFDPLKDLDSISVAAAGADDTDQMLIVARGKFDAAKMKTLGEAMAKDKDKKDKFKIHTVDGNTIYEATMENQPKPIFFALVDGNTIVGGLKQSDVTDAFAIKSGKKPGAVKKELQGLLARANPSQSISIVALGAALGNGVPFGDKVEHINGGISLADDIRTDFVITTKDDDSAKGLAEMIQQGLDQGKQFVSIFAQQNKDLAPAAELIDVLKVNANKNTISIKGDVTKEALEKLKKK